MKYEYHLLTWGGFYNEEYWKTHGKTSGDFWFDTEEERQAYMDELKSLEWLTESPCLAIKLSEGYNCRIRTVIHRVVEWKGERHYSSNDLGANYPFNSAQFVLENKWYPGFNDYPLGEDFDYENNEVKIIQEWITGAFKPEY